MKRKILEAFTRSYWGLHLVPLGPVREHPPPFPNPPAPFLYFSFAKVLGLATQPARKQYVQKSYTYGPATRNKKLTISTITHVIYFCGKIPYKYFFCYFNKSPTAKKCFIVWGDLSASAKQKVKSKSFISIIAFHLEKKLRNSTTLMVHRVLWLLWHNSVPQRGNKCDH